MDEAEARQVGRDQAALVRGLLTGFELAKAQCSTVTVDLPLGWHLKASCRTSADPDGLEELDGAGLDSEPVTAGLSFKVRLPNGTEISSWPRLTVALRELHDNHAPETNPLTQPEPERWDDTPPPQC